MKWLELVRTLAPFILAAVPGVPPVLIPAIIHGIQTAEQIPGASGPQKKAAVLDLVSTGITAANTVAGRPLVNKAHVTGAVSAGIDATVNAVNAIRSATSVPDSQPA